MTKLFDEVQALVSERDRLRDALTFYANSNNWRSATVYMCGHSGETQATFDGGKKARAALEAKQ